MKGMPLPNALKLNDGQKKVYNYVLEKIVSDELSVGSTIPTEMELAQRLKTTRMNAHWAIRRLADLGILSRNKRDGTRIARIPNSFMLGEMKRPVTSYVTVLNPLAMDVAHIHWNSEIVEALEDGLGQHGLGLRVVDVSGVAQVSEMSDLLRELAREGVGALLCISCDALNDMLYSNPEIFFNYHRDVFVFARNIVNWSMYPYNTVSVDLFNEGVIAAEHAHVNGYERILLGLQQDICESSWFKARKAGVFCGWRRFGGTAENIHDLDQDCTAAKLREALASEEQTMVVAVNDHTAVPLIDRIKDLTGKQAGRDYGLVSFDNDTHCRTRKLSTIAPPLHEIGEALADLIGASVGRESNSTSFIKIRSRLIKGSTS